MMEFALAYPVDVRSVALKGFIVTLETDDKERARLAQNHGLLAVSEFSAEFHLKPWKKRGIRIQGEIRAVITQACVVSGEPVVNRIKQPVEVIYVPQDSRLAKPVEPDNTYELFLDAEGPDAPEVFEGNEIDVGALAEEFFELAINPYPRKPCTAFNAEGKETDNAGEEVKSKSPFHVLKNLKDS